MIVASLASSAGWMPTGPNWYQPLVPLHRRTERSEHPDQEQQRGAVQQLPPVGDASVVDAVTGRPSPRRPRRRRRGDGRMCRCRRSRWRVALNIIGDAHRARPPRTAPSSTTSTCRHGADRSRARNREPGLRRGGQHQPGPPEPTSLALASIDCWSAASQAAWSAIGQARGTAPWETGLHDAERQRGGDVAAEARLRDHHRDRVVGGRFRRRPGRTRRTTTCRPCRCTCAVPVLPAIGQAVGLACHEADAVPYEFWVTPTQPVPDLLVRPPAASRRGRRPGSRPRAPR